MPDSTEDFYPGSIRRRDAPTPPPEPEEEITWDENPRTLILNGKEVEFFPVGALAEALNRKVVTIYKWERLGYLPKAVYRAPGDRQDRLYTRAQIQGLQAIAKEEGLLDTSKRVVVNQTNFTARAVRLFEALKGRT